MPFFPPFHPFSPKYIPPVSSLTISISRFSPIISSLRGQAFFNALCIVAGLRFAYRPRFSLRPSSAISGLNIPDKLSHFGPPTAPKRTLSLVLHIFIVSSGRHSPVSSIADPPASALLNSNSCPNTLPVFSNTSQAALQTSGPIPSPSITATLNLPIVIILFI